MTPIDNRAALGETMGTICHVTVSSFALPFFFCLRAISNKNSGLLVVVASRTAVHIGQTKYCAFSNFKSYHRAATITITLFDTSVVIAVTYFVPFDQPSPHERCEINREQI